MSRRLPKPVPAIHSHARSSAALVRTDGRPLSNLERLQTEDVREGLARRLGGRISVDEFIATTSGLLRNPELAKCRPSTLFGALFEAAQLGLRPDPTLQHCFLIPVRNGKASRELGRQVVDCKLVIGYRGLIMLAMQGSEALVEKVSADVVYASDVFEDIRGMSPDIVHKRRRTKDRADRGDPVAVYAVVHLRGTSPSCEVLDWWEVEELRRAARGGSPWSTYPEEMAKKTAIRRALKYVPLSPVAARGIDLDDRAEAGDEQYFDVRPEEIASTEPNELPADDTIDTEGVERIPGVDDVEI